MRNLDIGNRAHIFLALQVEHQNLVRALCGNKQPAALLIDAQMVESSLDRSRHRELRDRLQRRLRRGKPGQEHKNHGKTQHNEYTASQHVSSPSRNVWLKPSNRYLTAA